MKNDLRNVLQIIKNNKKNLLILLVLIWLIISPYTYTKSIEIIKFDLDYTTLILFVQKILACFFTILIYICYKQYVDESMIEIIYTSDTRLKIRYVFYFIILFQVFFIPIYFIVYNLTENYHLLLYFIFQEIFISVLFYSLGYIFKNSFLSIGILLIFIFLFNFIFSDFYSIYNFQLFIFNTNSYFIYNGIMLAFMLFIGIILERNIFYIYK